MVGVWDGIKLGSTPNFFQCFGTHPKINDIHPKLIPKRGVVQFCHLYHLTIEYLGRVVKRCPWPPMCGNEATTVPVAPNAPNVSVIKGFFFLLLFDDQKCKELENTM